MSEQAVQTEQTIGRHQIIVLLIDDQAMVGEAVRRMLLGEENISYHFCSDPSKAIGMANELAPTVILQDLVMPEVDGLTLVKFFRRNQKTKDIPLIVLSSKEEAKTKAEAFALGANDYLVKLPDKIELIARIRHHSAGYINMLERNEAFKALQESQQRLAAELAEAADYVASMLPKKLDGPIKTDWKFVSSTSLGGDAFGYHWLDDNHFAMYLLDVCGHGVGAALLSISVMEALRSQNLPNTDFSNPGNVLTRLNDEFQMEDHHQMYFTIWYGVYNKQERKIVYSSGGHPPALLISGTTASDTQIHDLRTKGAIIGGFPGLNYENKEIALEQYNKLLILSDGVYEITRPGLPDWHFEAFRQYISSTVTSSGFHVEKIYHDVLEMYGSRNLEDDFSLIEINL
ncbi:MAG: SpoIIE family protein phosphatase [Victivallaceae bacterium]|jgi:sigma-B regulation protein RsbU (phosphoserine phosphatase)